jgi:cell division protein FtsZ
MQRSKRAAQMARIRVVGVGGGGRTAVNQMVAANFYGVDFLTVDTDVTALKESRAPFQLRIGDESALDRGAAGIAERGQRAALFSIEAIRNALHGSDLVFIIAGLGGGTGTGAAPIIAQAAKEQNALAIGIVTYPFSFEGERVRTARKGIAWLKSWTDTLIVIPNDRLLKMANGAIGFHETYRLAHEVWYQSVQGVSELISSSGLINVDFADVRSIMSEGGGAIIASGRAQGKDRARYAAEKATQSDLLGLTIDGAHGVLFNVSGGTDMNLLEVERAAEIITSRAHPQANVIFGAAIDPRLEDEIRITVIATGFGFGDIREKKVGSTIRRARPAGAGQPWQLEAIPFSPADNLRGD